MLRRKLMGGRAEPMYKTVSGSMVTFNTVTAAPLKSLIANIDCIQDGSGDPSPDNERLIKGWNTITGRVTKKNLLALPIVAYNTITPYGNNSTFNSSDYFWIKAGTYILSYSCNSKNRWLAKLFDKDGKALSDTFYKPNSSAYYNTSYHGWYLGSDKSAGDISSPLNIVEDCYIRICRNWTNPDTVSFTNSQFEIGSIVTTYEPYNGTSYSIAIQTPPEVVYGGTLDLITGTLTVDWTSVIYDGSEDENWKVGSNMRYNIAPTLKPYYVRASAAYIKGSTSKPTSAQGIGSSMEDRCCIYGKNTIGILKASIQNDITSFKAFLAEHPAQLVYKLATPIVYQLTPVQINALLGTNNIWANTGDVSVTYQFN